MKKLLLTMFGAMLPLITFAYDFEYTYEGQTLTYTVIDENQKTVCVAKNDVSGDLIIPATAKDGITDYTVTSIGENAFYNCSGLKSVIIPNSVTSIENSAFYECSGLTSINIPNSVTGIAERTFYKCSGLTSVTIPESVTSIEAYAFGQCTGLTLVTIPNSVTSIGNWAFYDCSGLTSITLSNKLTSIGYCVFRDCSNLISVTIPDSVITIDVMAFYNCSCMTSITIPNSVTEIGAEAFCGCSGLTSVTIPDSVKFIGSNAFSGCTGLTKTEFASIESLCNISFEDSEANPISHSHKIYVGGNEVKDLVIPNSVTSIGWYAFCSCSGLTSVTFPESVIYIGKAAFWACSGLKSVIIPNSVTSIGEEAFWFCNDLTSVTFGNSLTSIGARAFYFCDGLTTITIPESVTSIGNQAFYDCEGLKTVYFNAKNCTSCGTLEYRVFPWTLETVEIGHKVTRIPAYAFSYCYGLSSVIIPNNVTEIEEGAFHNSGLETISIGYGIKKIGEKTFEDCEKLSVVNITAEEAPEAFDNTFNKYEGVSLYVMPRSEDNYVNAVKCWNNFKPNTLVVPESLTLNKYEVKAQPGEQFSLQYSFEPSDVSIKELCIWSSNPDVATVDREGLVTMNPDAPENSYCEIHFESLYPDVETIAYINKNSDTGIEEIVEDINSSATDCNIYSLQGVCLKRNAKLQDVDALAPGLYIIGGKKVVVK